MVNIEFSIWLASKTRWVHLKKNIKCQAIPRVGEYVKFKNEGVGDYFSWQVSLVTYHESGLIEVWTELLDNVDERGYSFESEAEFDEYHQSYLTEGWYSERPVGENKQYNAAVCTQEKPLQ